MPNNNQSLDSHSVSIWPTLWQFALIIAAFKLIYSLLLRATGLAGTAALGLLGIVVTIVLLVLALKRYRSLNGGYMTFGQGFGIAFVASIVSTVVSAAIDSIYLASFGEEQLAALREGTLNQMRGNPGVDAQAMEGMASLFEVVYTPTGMFVMAIVLGTLGWGIVSLILAALQKRPPPITD